MTRKTKSEVRADNIAAGGHFFDRATMNMHGDTMRSFKMAYSGDRTFIYRHENAIVTTFRGERVRAGRDFFRVWEVMEDGHIRGGVEKSITEMVWQGTCVRGEPCNRDNV